VFDFYVLDNPAHGYSTKQEESLWKNIHQVHPYFDPRMKEKPLITVSI